MRLPDGVITSRQAAEKYGVGINTIHRLQNERILPWWVRRGTTKPRLMHEADFVAWILGNDPRRG